MTWVAEGINQHVEQQKPVVVYKLNLHVFLIIRSQFKCFFNVHCVRSQWLKLTKKSLIERFQIPQIPTVRHETSWLGQRSFVLLIYHRFPVYSPKIKSFIHDAGIKYMFKQMMNIFRLLNSQFIPSLYFGGNCKFISSMCSERIKKSNSKITLSHANM